MTDISNAKGEQKVVDDVRKTLMKVVNGDTTLVDSLTESIRLMAKNEAMNMMDEFLERLTSNGQPGQVLTKGNSPYDVGWSDLPRGIGFEDIMKEIEPRLLNIKGAE